MAEGARRALLIATGSYADQNFRALRAPAADAQQLAAVLEAPEIGDFAVEVMLDADEGQLTRRLARFFRDAKRNDVLLVHLSCHGIKDDRGDLYFATTDTEIDLPDATAIAANWLNDQIAKSMSRRILLLLDCCFSGRFPFGTQHRAGDRVDVQEHFRGKGHAVITASNAMEYAFEGVDRSGQGQPSYFTQAVIDALRTGEADRDGDHWISVDELYDYVYDRVKEKTPNQTPIKKIELEGPLYVAHSVYEPPIEPAELDPWLISVTENPVAKARLEGIEVLARLLASTNKSIALAARLKLEEMKKDDDSRSVARRATQVLAERERAASESHGLQITTPALASTEHELPEHGQRDAEEHGHRDTERRDGEQSTVPLIEGVSEGLLSPGFAESQHESIAPKSVDIGSQEPPSAPAEPAARRRDDTPAGEHPPSATSQITQSARQDDNRTLLEREALLEQEALRIANEIGGIPYLKADGSWEVIGKRRGRKTQIRLWLDDNGAIQRSSS